MAEIGRDRGERSAGGRYYGQPLKPQHLLQELDEIKRPDQKRRTKNNWKAQYSSHDDQPLHNRHVGPLLVRFRNHIVKSELVPAWQTLIRLRADSLDTGDVRINQSMDTMKRLHQLMRRVVGDFIKNLGTESLDQPGTRLPSPWTFALVARDLGLMTSTLRAELLWRLGNALVMKTRVDGEFSPEDRDFAFHQLTLIWYDTLRMRLQHDAKTQGQALTRPTMEWSFLPPPEAVTKGSSGSQVRLEETLAMILPTDKSNDVQHAKNVADYQSALFVTLDLLKGDAYEATSRLSNVDTESHYWKPMVDFFDEVLLQVSKPDVPPTILSRLVQAEDPTLAYYEAMVRRFELANIPAIRTDRSKAISDVHRGVARYTEVGQLMQKQAPALQSTTTPEIKATESALPKDSADKKTGPVISLDKDSLREAGFSAAQEWDMDSDVFRPVFDWVKRLGRSIETSNLLLAEKCWKEVREFNSEQGSSSLPLFLYEHFMLAFLSLRQPKLAVEAWTAVLQAGLQPTVKSWTVMMRGCALANDADTMEKFWARMKDQGVQPDRHAWSVRLSGLIKADRINKAFSALQGMGEEWIKAVRAEQRNALPVSSGKKRALANLPDIDLSQWSDDVKGVARPDLVVLNSVVSSLANKADQHIPRVLSWARDFAIELDLTTFNALLNVAMRHGQTAEATSILQHMKTRSIEPNSTTITVVLTALFQSDLFTNLSTDEQTKKLFSLIAIIESSSPTAKLDVKGYALAIDRMLKQHQNPAAARALLEHMSARGLEPTSHIYTILMSSYFEADPPDFAAADALWARLQQGNAGYGVALDTIFYDRMVEGYARHHAHVGIAPMMQFLERMSREGKRPGWRMLELVARALADRDEWGLLHGLVDDIRLSKGLTRVGVRGLVGQNEFWRYILSTGVLERDGVKSEQDVRKGVGGSSFQSLSGL